MTGYPITTQSVPARSAPRGAEPRAEKRVPHGRFLRSKDRLRRWNKPRGVRVYQDGGPA